MRISYAASAALVALLVAGCLPASDPIAPKLDKARVEAYLRYAEGYTANVQFVIDDPLPSSYPEYFRVPVHLTSGSAKIERVYYVTRDGQHFINGAVWDLNDSPFQETLKHLPSDGYSFGPADAKVTIVVFSDFQCPYCQKFAKTTRENLPQKYPKDVRVIFKDFPLETIHPWARAAAEASHCIGNQKPAAFWAFHDWIFDHQNEVNAANLREKTLDIAKQQNLEAAKTGACIDSHATASEVESSIQQGLVLQVQQTPTVFVNGRIEPGALPWTSLDALVEFELGRPNQVPGPTAQNCCEIGILATPKK